MGEGVIGALFFFVAFALAGLIVRVRAWIVVALAFIVCPAWFGGLRLGLWGAGVGDNWQELVAVLTVGSIAGAMTGVLAGRFVTRNSKNGAGR